MLSMKSRGETPLHIRELFQPDGRIVANQLVEVHDDNGPVA